MFMSRTPYEKILSSMFPTPRNNAGNFNYETTTITERPGNSFLNLSEKHYSVEFSKEDNGTRATIPVPGVSKENINVKVKNKERIVVNAKVDEKYSTDNSHTQSVRDIKASFAVPHSFSQEEIEVKHENGVLEIFIPSHDEVKDNEYTVDF